MIDAGILSERISIYVPKSEHYNLTTLSDYELLKTVWANVRQITTREQLRYGIDVQSGQMTVLIRYLAGISDDCLILWRGSYYSIDNISPDKAAGEILMGVSYSGLNENRKVVT
jgi:head-tail adaptor